MEKSEEKAVSRTLRIKPSSYKRLKVFCAMKELTISEFIDSMINEQINKEGGINEFVNGFEFRGSESI